jgi:hypothetical protein
MQNLQQVKIQASNLTLNEKQELVEFLSNQISKDHDFENSSNGTSYNSTKITERELSQQRIEWMKTHREEFANRYIILDGIQFIGDAKTFKEANELAKTLGIAYPFITHLASINDTPFGGW